MKHLKLSFVIIYVFIASSCGSTSDTSTQVNPHAAPHIEMHKELIKEENQKVMNRKILKEISGTYLGMLPCNDCEKIIYRLQLNEDETYKAKITYQGKENTVLKKGRFKISDRMVVELDDYLNGMNFFIPESKGLLLLDKNGNKFTGEKADQYYLLPIAGSAENNKNNRFMTILQKKNVKGIDFFAFGNEPSWSLDMDFEKMIHFKDLDGIDFTAPAVEGIKAMDANDVRYRSVTDSGEIIVEIHQTPCSDSMAGDKFDYSVTIDYKRTGDSDYKTFKGCGTYVPDFRLHDIWAIIEVDGKKIDASSFKEKAPMMEINITNNTVSGSNGCNNFSGGVRTENGKVIFTPLASTLRACIDNQEISSKISTVLSGNTLNYKFENNLVLYKNGIRVMVLKHID